MAPTADGGGYWLVASDGGIFSYGDAGLLRLDRLHPPEPAHCGDGADPRRPRLLDGGRRRRHLHLRERAVLRITGRSGVERARPGDLLGHRRLLGHHVRRAGPRVRRPVHGLGRCAGADHDHRRTRVAPTTTTTCRPSGSGSGSAVLGLDHGRPIRRPSRAGPRNTIARRPRLRRPPVTPPSTPSSANQTGPGWVGGDIGYSTALPNGRGRPSSSGTP